MKRSAALVLIELVIMLTVFALAAALCVQAFAWADNRSRQSAAADMALLQAQNAAELLKHHRGDFSSAARDQGGQWDGTAWTISYDAAWKPSNDSPAYILRAEPVPRETENLGKAKLTVLDREGAVLAELSVCWQEVST